MAKGKKGQKHETSDPEDSSITKVAKKIAAEESDDGEDGKVKPSGESQKAGKSKKDRKKKREEELEAAQLELEQLNNKNNNDDLDDENDEDLEVRKKPAAKKDKKGNKKKQQQKRQESGEEDEDDVDDDGDGGGLVAAPAATKAKSGPKPKSKPVVKKAFALLMSDDDDDDDVLSDERPPSPVKVNKVKAAASAAKKAGKQKKPQDSEDEDDNENGKSGASEDEEPAKGAADKKAAAKKGKKAKAKSKKDNEDDDDVDGMDELEKALTELGMKDSTSAPAATESESKNKKKEKKERQKQKQLLQEEAGDVEEDRGLEEAPEKATAGKKAKKAKKEPQTVPAAAEGEQEASSAAAAAGKKGKKGVGPGGKTLLAMQEALKKVKEEEEKRRKAEEERIRLEEEAEEARLEQLRLEEERKALKKQREKEKKEQLKKEGKYLTPKQRQEKARVEARLAAMRASGLEVPDAKNEEEKRAPRPGTRIRNKPAAAAATAAAAVEEVPEAVPEEDSAAKVPESEAKGAVEEIKEAGDDEPKDSWEDDEDDGVVDSWENALDEVAAPKVSEQVKDEAAKGKVPREAKKPDVDEDEDGDEDDEDDEDKEDDDDDEDDDDEEDDDDDDEDDDDEEDDHTEAEKRRERAMLRIQKRREENEKNRSVDVLRAPVVCVLGHVDTGKTKILDKLRRTNVQDGEAGGITQQIGATNVPKEVILEQCKMVKQFKEMKLPGLLIIDTPGHESFSNLRDRGSSLCDIAILVVDIMHGLEPQTIESINLLKKKKVPFIIALNKIDRLYEWRSNRHKDVEDVAKGQPHNTKLEFDKRAKEAIVGMAEQGLNAALFWENPDPKTYVSVVPTSAHSGEGMGNLMALIVSLSQSMLAKRLSFSEELQATVLEVKAISGLGTTIDIVLVNGTLREGQSMILAGTDGPIVTPIKALLTPSKMQDLRVKNTYIEHKELRAAQGVKIAAKDLEKAIAGLNMLVAQHPDEIEILKEETQARLQSVLQSFKVKERGVFVQASTLGSLEALLEFLKSSKIPYAGVKIGPVVKRDVMKASVMLEHEEKYTVILAFDVKVERDAQEMADSMGVKIFQADIIYHLFDRFTAYQEELKQQKRDQFKNVAVFPCKLKFLPNFIFNSRDPIVAGVVVEAGVVRQGTPLCVPSKEFVEIGICTSIESNHKEVTTARKGEEVCIKVEPLPGQAPKMFGRHFDEKDAVVSKISRTSIDACKNYFREDLQKSDWQLMVELKNLFQIL